MELLKDIYHLGKLPNPLIRSWTTGVRSFITSIMRAKEDARMDKGNLHFYLQPIFEFFKDFSGSIPNVNIQIGEGAAIPFLWLTVSQYGIKFLDAKLYSKGIEMQLTTWTPIPCTFREFLQGLKNKYPYIPVQEANILQVLTGRGIPFVKIIERIIEKHKPTVMEG